MEFTTDTIWRPRPDSARCCGNPQRVDADVCKLRESKTSGLPIERRGSDPILEEKVNASMPISRRRRRAHLKARRAPCSASERTPAHAAGAREHKMAFDAYLRNGPNGAWCAGAESAMSVAPIRMAAIPCPSNWRRIGASLRSADPAISAVRTISATVYKSRS